jgi:hypothetical protein
MVDEGYNKFTTYWTSYHSDHSVVVHSVVIRNFSQGPTSLLHIFLWLCCSRLCAADNWLNGANGGGYRGRVSVPDAIGRKRAAFRKRWFCADNLEAIAEATTK